MKVLWITLWTFNVIGSITLIIFKIDKIIMGLLLLLISLYYLRKHIKE